eukprot:TRINITY_DN21918_c0_g1_i2.p1 TRINITY_DN21918_c0_g1~~TRINITY_DN21918_c0_g1_i2.p1  ORF type:complete len:280 (-),score=51.43 TRINITY_DN21918_c0_g1_i2:11-850(-)
MGNCSSSSEPSTPSESSAQHLIVFAHGLTASATAAHPAHGRALEELLQDSPSEAVALHFSRSNAGGSGASTFLHTCTVGLKKGGELLAAEVAQVAATMPALTHISLIGASLGGLFARHASALLWGGAAPLLPAHVHPHALVTLASPHLGVRCTPANGPMLKAASCMARTVQDLNWTDGSFGSTPSLVYMGREEAVHVLTLFKHRVAYAPLVDDKVVCWSTAAFSGQPSPSHDTHTAVGCAREVCSQRAAEWVGEQCYFCLLYTSPSPRDRTRSRMPSSA